MRKLVTLSSFLFLLTLIAPAQEEVNQKSLSLLFGAGYLQRQDLVFSPFIHRDFAVQNFGLAYTKESRLFSKIGIHYSGYSSLLVEPYEYLTDEEQKITEPHSFNLFDLDYYLGVNLLSHNRYELIIGGGLFADIQTMNYAYGRIGFFGYHSTFALGGFGLLKYKLNGKSWLAASIQLPLLTFMARSPYLINDDEYIKNISTHNSVVTFFNFLADGELVFLNKIQHLDLSLGYNYRLSARWQGGINYQWAFIHTNIPAKLISNNHSFLLSATYIL